MAEQIITTKRQKDFLNALGFDFKTKKVDLKNNSNYIYVYEATEELIEAVEFFKHMRFTLKTKMGW